MHLLFPTLNDMSLRLLHLSSDHQVWWGGVRVGHWKQNKRDLPLCCFLDLVSQRLSLGLWTLSHEHDTSIERALALWAVRLNKRDTLQHLWDTGITSYWAALRNSAHSAEKKIVIFSFLYSSNLWCKSEAPVDLKGRVGSFPHRVVQ